MADAKIILSAEDKTGAAIESAKRGFNQLQGVAAAVSAQFGLLGGGATLAGFAAIVKGANDAIDAMNDVSDATGASIENISALQRVAKLYGHDVGISTTLLMKFNKELASTAKPGSEAENIFKQLGLSAAELRRIDPAEALQRTAVAFEQFANNGERARNQEMLFGKATREGAAYLKDLADSGQLVATVTTQQAEEAEKFNRELLKLQANASSVGKTLALELIPRINNIFETMRASKPVVYDFWQEWEQGLRRVSPGISMLLMATRALTTTPPPANLTSAAGAGRGTVNPDVVRPSMRVTDPQEEARRLAAAAEAQRKAERELAEERKRGFDVVKLRNELVEKAAKDEEKKVSELAKIHEEWAKAIQRQTDLQRKNSQEYLDGIDKQIFAASAMVQAAQDEYDTYGMSASQIAKLTLVRLEDARAVQLLTALTFEDLRAIDAQIAAQKKLIAIYEKGELRSANEETARKARDDWDRAFQQVGQSLTDYIMQGGKNGADYLQALFRTLVLRPVISAAVNPVAGAVTSALGIGGPGGAGSTLSGIGALSGSFGGGLNAGFSSLFNEAGLGGAFSAGSGALSAGNIAGGLGTFAGALAPFLAGAGLLASLQGGETRGGGQYKGTNLLAAPSGGQIDAANITGAIGTTTGTINALLGRLGSSTRLSEFFSGLETSDNGKGFAYAGGALSTGAVFGQGQNGLGYLNRRGNFDAAGAVTAFGEELSQAALQALQADLDNLPDYVRKYLEGIDVDAMGKDAADKLLASIDAVATQRATLEQQIYELTTSDAQKLLDVRTREREAIDASNSTLLDRVYALQDEKTAAAEAAAAAQEKARIEEQAAAAAQEKARIEEQVAQQRNNLQTQLWQMEGNTAALRGAELAALDPSNRALQQHIWALQDQATAAETARAAQDRYNQSLSEANQFLAGVGATIGGYLARLNTTDAGLLSPQSQLVNARELYQQQLTLARSGDRGALSNITQYADSFLNASKAYSGSGGATGSILDALRGDLAALPNQVRPEQLIVDAVNQTTAAVGTLQTSLIASLNANFGQFDTSLNGALDFKEFAAGLSKFASEDTLRQMFLALDSNGDSQLSRLEALGGSIGSLQSALVASLNANFGQLDTSLNGALDFKEFAAGLSKFASEDTLKALFTSLDANGDGQLTRLESLGQTADKQLAAADLQNRQLEAIGFQQRQLDSIWQRLGGANDYLSQILQQQYYDGQRQDFQSVQFDALWRRLGDLANAGGGGGGGDTINIRVVTPSGSELTNTVITNLRERSRWGEIVVYASGVGA